MRKTLGSRCISSRSAWLRASRYVSVAINSVSGKRLAGSDGIDPDVPADCLPLTVPFFGIHVSIKLFWSRVRCLIGELIRLLDLLHHTLVHGPNSIFIHQSVGDQP